MALKFKFRCPPHGMETSAPGLADEMALAWRKLPRRLWPILTFSILDRVMRMYLPKCFVDAGREASAKKLAAMPAVTGLQGWMAGLEILHREADIKEPNQERDINLLAAYFSLSETFDVAWFEQDPETVLYEASFEGIMASRFASQSGEVALQEEAIAILRDG